MDRDAAQAGSERRQKLMAVDNALEKRLEAFVDVSRAYAEAIRDEQLVPGVVIGGDSTAQHQCDRPDRGS